MELGRFDSRPAGNACGDIWERLAEGQQRRGSEWGACLVHLRGSKVCVVSGRSSEPGEGQGTDRVGTVGRCKGVSIKGLTSAEHPLCPLGWEVH